MVPRLRRNAVAGAGDAVEEGTRNAGPRHPALAGTARICRVSINHPVIHQIPMLGRYFDIGPVPMSGSSTTVKQTTRLLGPSMRMNADLGDWERSLLNVQIAVGAGPVEALPGRVDGLLQRPELPDAVPQGGGQEHAGVPAPVEPAVLPPVCVPVHTTHRRQDRRRLP